MNWTEFFFGQSHWHDVIGWHLAIAIAAVIAWQLSKLVHKPKRKR
jgi:uncharacterized membrane protein